MGLRCLMGHDYGALQSEREREDRGGEAVVTVREFKECGRCGHRQIVSENKEVTTTGAGQATSDESPTIDVQPEPEPSTEPAAEYDDVTAEEDDGVILDDSEPEEEEREPGDWPDAPDEEGEADHGSDEEAGYDPWPEVEGEDEGYAAEPSEGGPAQDVEFGGGLTPEPHAEAAEAAASSSGEGSAPAGIKSVEPAGGQRTTSADARVVCPECDHTAPAKGSSLRPGDICPECQRGYLVEREP